MSTVTGALASRFVFFLRVLLVVAPDVVTENRAEAAAFREQGEYSGVRIYFREIGQFGHITRERIRQLQNAAKAKLHWRGA